RASAYTYTDGAGSASLTWDGVNPDAVMRINLAGLTVGRKYRLSVQGDNAFTETSSSYANQIRNSSDVIVDILTGSEQGTTDVNYLEFTATSTSGHDLLLYSKYAGS